MRRLFIMHDGRLFRKHRCHTRLRQERTRQVREEKKQGSRRTASRRQRRSTKQGNEGRRERGCQERRQGQTREPEKRTSRAAGGSGRGETACITVKVLTDRPVATEKGENSWVRKPIATHAPISLTSRVQNRGKRGEGGKGRTTTATEQCEVG